MVLLIYIMGRVTGGKSITNWKYYDLEQHTDLTMSLNDLNEIMIPMGYENTYNTDSSANYKWDNFVGRDDGDFRSKSVEVFAFMESGQLKLEVEHRGNFGFFEEERIDSTFSEISNRYQQLSDTQ